MATHNREGETCPLEMSLSSYESTARVVSTGIRSETRMRRAVSELKNFSVAYIAGRNTTYSQWVRKSIGNTCPAQLQPSLVDHWRADRCFPKPLKRQRKSRETQEEHDGEEKAAAIREDILNLLGLVYFAQKTH